MEDGDARMMQLHPGDLDRLIHERQARLRAPARPSRANGLRLRVARGLIAAGMALGGERAERLEPRLPARPSDTTAGWNAARGYR